MEKTKREINKENKITLKSELDILEQVARRARVYFDLWWICEGYETRSKNLQAMNRYPEFFRFDSHAHEMTYIMYLCQIFENNSKTLNITNVIKQAKAQKLSEGQITNAEQALCEAKPIYKKLLIIRHNLFAHRNISLSYKSAFEKANITPNEIRNLTELGLKAVNSLLVALGQNKRVFSELPGKDLSKLLENIKAE